MQQLLLAMIAVRDGDFSVQLPPHFDGLQGKLADTFNEIVSANEIHVPVGRPVRLVWLGRPARHLAAGDRPYDTGDQVSFADEYPLLLANRASLDTLNGWLAQEGAVAVPMTRFRPNLVVDAALPWIEEEWAGRRLRIGEVEFRAAGACGRCVVTTVDQVSGVRGRQPLRTLVRRHTVDGKPRFGLHLVPLGPGTIAAGDPVEPLD